MQCHPWVHKRGGVLSIYMYLSFIIENCRFVTWGTWGPLLNQLALSEWVRNSRYPKILDPLVQVRSSRLSNAIASCCSCRSLVAVMVSMVCHKDGDFRHSSNMRFSPLRTGIMVSHGLWYLIIWSCIYFFTHNSHDLRLCSPPWCGWTVKLNKRYVTQWSHLAAAHTYTHTQAGTRWCVLHLRS